MTDLDPVALEEAKLLPCPFCGWEARIAKSGAATAIACDSCGVAPYVYRLTEAEARAAWNRRAASVELQAERDALSHDLKLVQTQLDEAESSLSTLRSALDEAATALEEARRFALRVIRDGVELDDFDLAEHALIKQIDAARTKIKEATNG